MSPCTRPTVLPVQIGILDGVLTNLTVLQRVNAETGAVVYAPQLRGTLTLKNTSSDQAMRLVNGEVHYLDAGGAPIALAKDRGETRFRLDSYASERLDPGMEVSHRVDAVSRGRAEREDPGPDAAQPHLHPGRVGRASGGARRPPLIAAAR